jgi:hypothetical protein
VSEEQAAEIIVRTDDWHFSSNDSTFETMLRKTAGMPPPYNYDKEMSNKERLQQWRDNEVQEAAVMKAHGVLSLNYLHNERIVSCFIGGPHGWCDWSGNIFCNSFNIGKWPSVTEVLQDWETIAQAFPYLDLRSQLLSGESCENGITPLVEFIVRDGKVELVDPERALLPAISLDISPVLFCEPPALHEGGCTIKQFEQALAIARGHVAPNP